MPISAAHKAAIEEVVTAILTTTSRRTKRNLSEMFLDLVDRDAWPEYYEVIPQPRCIHGVKSTLAQNKYRHALDAFEDLNLVFLNALHYNEEGSQIAKDAKMLQGILVNEWKRRSVLPAPPTSPPPSSPQKVHAVKEQKEHAAAPSTLPKIQPAPSKTQPKAPDPSPMDVDPAPVAPPSETQPKEDAKAKRKSPDNAPPSDIEVDIGGTPEPEAAAQDAAREGEGDEIIKQLERGLPRWEGFADVGWAGDISSERMIEVVVTLAKYRDASGDRPADSLETVPEEMTMPDLSLNTPLSLRLVETRARAGHYASPQAFDREMCELFLKARRWYEPGTEAYGRILVLQRFYHALASPNPPVPPYNTTTKFAGLPVGPANSKGEEAGAGVTMFRVSLKDRTIVDEVQFKGWTIRLADWLHLSNPDDPSRPIIGQVFKCYISEESSRKGLPGVTVCWYYRPEQTFHTADRQFYEREVLKTGHFVDHPAEDIIEKIACQFTARHVRGRPRPPFWYPGWPLYVCDNRYHERDHLIVRIKNWNSCIPDEVRKNPDFMPIYPFERIVFPRRIASPFTTNPSLEAPGGIENPTADGAATSAAEKPEETTSGLRKRPKRAAAAKSDAERLAVLKGIQPLTAASSPQPAQQAQHLPPPPPAKDDRSIIAAAGGQGALGNSTWKEELPSETARHFDRDPETNEVLWFAAPPVDMVHPPPPTHSLRYLAHIARKRKAAAAVAESVSDGATTMDVDGLDGLNEAPSKKKMPLTATETLEKVLKEHGVL